MMRRFGGVLLALALTGLAACEGPAGDGLFAPASVAAPRAVAISGSPGSGAANPDYSHVVLLAGDPSIGVQSLTKVVYQTGKLEIAGNSLNIWRKPLSEPLVFTLTIVQKPYLAAQLKAVKLSDGTPVTTFEQPLDLRLSYAGSSTPIPDVKKLRMYYVVDGLVKEQEASSLAKKGQTVYANIWHFSEYSPGLDAAE